MGEPTENEMREWEDSQIAKGRTIHREGELFPRKIVRQRKPHPCYPDNAIELAQAISNLQRTAVTIAELLIAGEKA